MKTQNVNVVIVGVGGQGTLLTSKILAQLAMESRHGRQGQRSARHGAARRQRDHACPHRRTRCTHRLWRPASADYLLAFEPLEAARAIILFKDGRAYDRQLRSRSPPSPCSPARPMYPGESASDEPSARKQTVEALDAFSLAAEAGSYRAVNLVLLGALSRHLPFPTEDWDAAIAVCPFRRARWTSTARRFDAGRTYTGLMYRWKRSESR